MIVYLPALVFLVGLLAAYARTGIQRVFGIVLMVAAGAGSLALVVEPSLGAAWVIGPIAGSLLLRSRRAQPRLAFEALAARSTVVVIALLVGALAASKFPIGENPWPLTVVPWLLGAIGLAWLQAPRNEDEVVAGALLAVAGLAGVFLMAVPPGPMTAALAGAASTVPVIASRWQSSPGQQRAIRTSLLLIGVAAAAVAVISTASFTPAFFDLRLSTAGPALAGLVLVLFAAALQREAETWLAPLAGISLLALSPALRWAALAAVVAACTIGRLPGRRLAWSGVVMLALSPLVGALVTVPSGSRAEAVALAAGVTLLALASSAPGQRALVLPAASFVALEGAQQLAIASVVQFQWIAAAGAVMVVFLALTSAGPPGARRPALREALTVGLLLISIATRDPLDLGYAAAAVLVVELTIVRPSGSRSDALGRLSRSGWPPAAAFAGRVLAVAAAIQASIALGILAVGLVAGLAVAPVVDRARRTAAGQPRDRQLRDWLVATVSLGCGSAPAVFLRMLHQ